MSLELTVLVENTAKISSNLLSEHGLSLYLKCDDNLSLLFDMGATDLYLHNAAKMGIDIQSVDFLVFSHHHYDHVGGLKWFSVKNSRKIKLIAQKYAFYPRLNYKNYLTEYQLTEKFNIISIDSEPFELNNNLIFLSKIPRLNNFEGKNNFGKLILSSGEYSDDFCEDDTAIIYGSSEGIVLITGCSHSGICNIIQYAQSIAQKKWGLSKITAVIGGFHLVKANADLLKQTINVLRNFNIEEVYPCHCTDLNARIALASANFSVREITTGTTIAFS